MVISFQLSLLFYLANLHFVIQIDCYVLQDSHLLHFKRFWISLTIWNELYPFLGLLLLPEMEAFLVIDLP